MNIKGKELLATLDYLQADIEKIENLNILNITQDTRKVSAASCFICIRGSVVDGHCFIEQAIEAGAVVIIAEEIVEATVPVIIVPDTKKALAKLADLFFGHPSRQLGMIGVTGTNGKTTVTHLISTILSNNEQPTGIIGTMYAKYKDTIIQTVNTTPDAITTQGILHEMLEHNVKNCTMEVSSHALVQGRVWGVDFDVALFTNLSQDHLEYHHTMDEYFYAKSLLFSQLGNQYGRKKTAVINIDDSYGRKLVPLTAQNVLTYGCKGEGMFQATNILVTSTGTTFDLLFGDQTYFVSMKMVGDFNVYNALAAIVTCYTQGLSIPIIIDALSKIDGVKGRFELVPNEKNVTVIVDYAHTPDGLINVLETIQKFAQKNVYCVVGCGGDRDATKRGKMAEIAVQYADYPIFTSDNPRTEDPQVILNQMTEDLSKDTYQEYIDRKIAIEAALMNAQAGDVVLIAGKGHENYQIIGNVKHHFDDVEIVKEYFNK